MKKLMCVLILVAFLGSMVVMTGCFGGSSGGILAAAVFIIAISASGGSAAAFAADLRAAGASLTTHEITMVVQPLDAAGADTGTAMTIDESSITYDATTKEFKANKEIDIASGYNQYRIDVKAGGKTLVQSVKYLKDSEKTGTQAAKVDTTSTARTMVYKKWAALKSLNYGQFEYNLTLDNTHTASLTALVTTIDTELNTNVTNPDYTAAQTSADLIAPNVTTQAVPYTVSGYITAADLTSGQSDAWVYIYSDEAMLTMVNHVTTTNGNFSVSLSDGTYYFKPMKELHTYTPTSTKVVVSGADVTGVNFQAARVQ